ncbi:MAG TPA: type II toxin-antitoxin system VapC family toxin [Dehalococcoidia bacterium]|jgi:tRNA(fMet)-specific endonuclease VapC|nr:type II toxin-antitoxin system VapC family toxin [Dehalococcoidia bacterium]
MNYLLDADAIIDISANEPGATALIATVAQGDLAVAATTLVELYTGVYRSADPAQAERELKAFLRTVAVLPLTRAVITRAARIRADLLNRGLSIRTRAYDILAAAFALEHNLTLVTSNTRDYRGIPGLTQLNSRAGQLTSN